MKAHNRAHVSEFDRHLEAGVNVACSIAATTAGGKFTWKFGQKAIDAFGSGDVMQGIGWTGAGFGTALVTFIFNLSGVDLMRRSLNLPVESKVQEVGTPSDISHSG